MNLEFRRRSLLIPATTLLGSINNLSRIAFTADDRKAMIVSAVEEYLGYGYGVVGMERIINSPYYEGRFSHAVCKILDRQKVKAYSLELELNSLHSKVFQYVHELFLKYGMLTGEVVSRRANGEPGLFDHGYTVKVVTPKSKSGRNNGTWLLIEWVRPTLDMEEMSVSSFFLRIAKHLATRKQPIAYWLAVFHTTRLEAFLQIANFEILLSALRTAGRK